MPGRVAHPLALLVACLGFLGCPGCPGAGAAELCNFDGDCRNGERCVGGACAPDAPARDAGPADAGPSSDAGVADAGPADAGVADAGPSDAGVADAGPSDAGGDAGPFDAWARRLTLTVGAGDVKDDLSDFPVLVNLDGASMQIEVAASDGRDLRFAAADGTEMPYEIERWDPAATSSVWVKLPLLSANAPTVFFLHYGNPQAAAAASPADVWDESFRAVWHLGESAAGVAGEIKDSTANQNHGRGGNGTATRLPSLVAGQVGLAQRFDGVDDVIQVPSSDALNIAGPEITIEMWLSADASTSGIRDPLAKGGFDDGYRVGISDDGFGFQLTGAAFTLASSTPNVPGLLQYFVSRLAGGEMEMFLDGVPMAEKLAHPGNIDASARSLVIGQGDTAIGTAFSYPFPGVVDEVRISSVARSGAFIEAQLASMKGALVELGPDEAH